jgi:hypothetical protein
VRETSEADLEAARLSALSNLSASDPAASDGELFEAALRWGQSEAGPPGARAVTDITGDAWCYSAGRSDKVYRAGDQGKLLLVSFSFFVINYRGFCKGCLLPAQLWLLGSAYALTLPPAHRPTNQATNQPPNQSTTQPLLLSSLSLSLPKGFTATAYRRSARESQELLGLYGEPVFAISINTMVKGAYLADVRVLTLALGAAVFDLTCLALLCFVDFVMRSRLQLPRASLDGYTPHITHHTHFR